MRSKTTRIVLDDVASQALSRARMVGLASDWL